MGRRFEQCQVIKSAVHDIRALRAAGIVFQAISPGETTSAHFARRQCDVEKRYRTGA